MAILDEYASAIQNDKEAKKRFDKMLIKDEKSVLTLSNSFAYWQNMLLEKTMRLFKYTNLPFKQRELEFRLLFDGWTGFVNDKKVGYAVTHGGMYGVTEYWDKFTNFIYAGPVFQGGDLKIDKECVIIDNTSLRSSIIPMINRYASLLAHAELSVKSAMISLRKMEVFAVEDRKTAEEVKNFHNALYKGEYEAIVNHGLVNPITNIGSTNSNTNAVMLAWDVREEIYRSYFNALGVRAVRDKKERMVVSEVDADAQMLLVNIHDMLQCREEGFDKVNEIFGLDIGVDLGDEFEYLDEDKVEKEGVEDEH